MLECCFFWREEIYEETDTTKSFAGEEAWNLYPIGITTAKFFWITWFDYYFKPVDQADAGVNTVQVMKNRVLNIY